MCRRERDPQLAVPRALAARELLDACAQGAVGGEGEDQPTLEPERVQAEQPSLGVDEGAARRAAQKRCVVLDARRDPAPARAAEAAPGSRDETEADAKAAAARVREREDRQADCRRSLGPLDRRRAGGVDQDHGDVAVDVDAGDLALGRATVREDDRARLAPDVVCVRQHLPVRHDDAAAEAPEADDGGADLLGDPLDARLDLVQSSHVLSLRSNLRLASYMRPAVSRSTMVA